MTKQFRALLVALSIACVFLSFVLMASAQSGRRVTRPSTPPPVPVATPEPSPVAKPSPANTAPIASLIVGMDHVDTFSRIPLGATSGVRDSFVNRLKASASLKVYDNGGSMTRGDAVQKAKSEKEGYVVWLQVALDRLGADQGAEVNIREVFIEYLVLAPGTAKTVTSGRTYPYAYQTRSVIPSTTTSGLYGDYRYNEAAKAAAERVMSVFKVPTRPIKLP